MPIRRNISDFATGVALLSLVLCVNSCSRAPLRGLVELRNPGFEESDNGAPSGWDMTGESRCSVAPHKGEGGSAALMFQGNCPYAEVTQEIVFPEALGGKTLIWSARAWGDEPGKRIHVYFHGMHLIRPFNHSVPHPMDGQWHSLSAQYTFPPNYAGNALVVGIVHGGDPTRPALVDAVQLEVRDARMLRLTPTQCGLAMMTVVFFSLVLLHWLSAPKNVPKHQR